MSDRETFEACYGQWNGETLVMGNALFERSYRVEKGCLYATSIVDKEAGVEWVSGSADCASWVPCLDVSNEDPEIVFSAAESRQMPVSRPALSVSLRADSKSFSRIHTFEIFPNSASITGRLTLMGDWADALGTIAVEPSTGPEPTGVERVDTRPKREDLPTLDTLDAFALAPQHLRLTQVSLMDRTDVHNELVFENEWLLLVNENALQLQGNVFVIEDNLTGNGLIVLKQAPLPGARPVSCSCDVRV